MCDLWQHKEASRQTAPAPTLALEFWISLSLGAATRGTVEANRITASEIVDGALNIVRQPLLDFEQSLNTDQQSRLAVAASFARL
jgi:hypothetical protein